MSLKSYKTHLFTGVVFFIISCSSGQKHPARQTKPAPAVVNVGNGKIVFEEKCATCHGMDGTAGIANAADLGISRLDTPAVIRTITHGKNSMPSFVNQLGTGEIEQIAQYVFTLRRQ